MLKTETDPPGVREGYDGGRQAHLGHYKPPARLRRARAAPLRRLPRQRYVPGAPEGDDPLAPRLLPQVEGEAHPAVLYGGGRAAPAHQEVLGVALVGRLVVPVAGAVALRRVVVVGVGPGRQHPGVLVVHVGVVWKRVILVVAWSFVGGGTGAQVVSGRILMSIWVKAI